MIEPIVQYKLFPMKGMCMVLSGPLESIVKCVAMVLGSVEPHIGGGTLEFVSGCS